MSQQNLDDANVHASLKQVCGEAMAKRVRSKLVIEAALASRFDESVSHAGVGKRSGWLESTAATGSFLASPILSP
jgi:hypothetical protein